jgi:hypothetical protein
MHTQFWLENMKETHHSEELYIGGRIISEWVLGKIWWEVVD